MIHGVPRHPDIAPERTGVLLINLGTPESLNRRSIRRFLAEFLSDPRVIEVNRILWQAVLRLVILNLRPGRVLGAYREVWDRETDESPLRRHTREQAEAVAQRFGDNGRRIDVAWAMRYGSPSIADAIEAMADRGCRRILLFALYPQYSATTTASAYDAAFAALARMRWQPAIRTAQPYHDDPAYIGALADSVTRHLEGLDWRPDRLLVSFHGLPKRYFEAGDPYYCYCAKTTRMLADRLGWEAGRVTFAFQSRFGREEWLRPYISDVVGELPSGGDRRIAVIAPGFAADCVETLEEVAIGLRRTFLAAGGSAFSYIPCLNAGRTGTAMLESLITRELSGWIA